MREGAWHPGIRFLLFLFAFIMLLEWLRPIGEVTNTTQIMYFIIFTAASLVMYAFRISWKIVIPALFTYIAASLYFIFYRDQFYMSGESWLRAFFTDIKAGVWAIFSADWPGINSEFRTVLFFILVWMFTYLIHYWVHVKQRLFLFLLMTFIYVAVLDTFTTYDGDHAIIRVVVIGFAILGILALVRLLSDNSIHYSTRTAIRWMVPLSSLIVFAVLIGFFGPKPQAIWPDPVAFIKSSSEKFGSTQKRIGYDQDDSKLGGDFVGDDRVVFKASSPVRTYWKIENKNVYTGKGWETGPDYVEGQNVSAGELTMLYDYWGMSMNTQSEAELEFEIDHGHIPYPSPMVVDSIYNPNENHESAFDRVTYIGKSSKLIPIYDDENKELKEAGIQFRSPTYYLDVLRNDQINDLTEMEIGEQLEQSLALPENLPLRVRELALKIAGETGSESIYDQVKAIEDYLTGEKFTYSKEGVPYPEENQDYVDQFLFETSIGYCDNFSSAMVVLVRSLGVPARWVKGYTAGDLVYDQQLGQSRYVITNNNAHSWAEVYFPSEGWVPFEPTKGFISDVRFSATQDITNDETENETTTAAEKPENKESEKPAETQMEGSDASLGIEPIKEVIVEHWKKALVILLGLIGVVILSYRTRGRWVPYIWVFYYKRIVKNPNYEQAYLQLLRELNRYGIKRKPGQTLREYAVYVDHFFSTSDMNRLTNAYEMHIYSGANKGVDWMKFQQRWERMILRTIA